jgi:hypothetical protein
MKCGINSCGGNIARRPAATARNGDNPHSKESLETRNRNQPVERRFSTGAGMISGWEKVGNSRQIVKKF